MGKITKRPKKVKVTFKETISCYSEYTCPSCHTTYVGEGITKKTTRFLCNCGQELIVKRKNNG